MPEMYAEQTIDDYTEAQFKQGTGSLLFIY